MFRPPPETPHACTPDRLIRRNRTRRSQFWAPVFPARGCSLATGVTSVSFTHNTSRGVVRRRFARLRGRILPAFFLAMAGAFGFAGHAFAQAASPAGGIGAQANLMSSEALNAGSTAFGMGCYLAAAICFGFGVWALWQSRQPQNRETGYVGRGIAGLILCGLFA